MLLWAVVAIWLSRTVSSRPSLVDKEGREKDERKAGGRAARENGVRWAVGGCALEREKKIAGRAEGGYRHR